MQRASKGVCVAADRSIVDGCPSRRLCRWQSPIARISGRVFPTSRERWRERFDRESAGSQTRCRIVVTQRGLVAKDPSHAFDVSAGTIRATNGCEGSRCVVSQPRSKLAFSCGSSRDRTSEARRRQASRRRPCWLSPSPHVSSPGAFGERRFVLDDEQATVGGSWNPHERAECATRDVRGR